VPVSKCTPTSADVRRFDRLADTARPRSQVRIDDYRARVHNSRTAGSCCCAQLLPVIGRAPLITHGRHPLGRICCCIAHKWLHFVKSVRLLTGTIWGPHVMRDDERPAHLCTSRMAANRPHAPGDQRKRVTAIYWGSSGRRFKSCQPDTGQRVFLEPSRRPHCLARQPGHDPEKFVLLVCLRAAREPPLCTRAAWPCARDVPEMCQRCANRHSVMLPRPRTRAVTQKVGG
jgi:hypothetical protein